MQPACEPGPRLTPLSSWQARGGSSSAFKSKTLRSQENSTKDVGDPGAYDPYSGSSVSAQKTFNKTQQTGTGGFGTTSKRAEFSTVSEAPGPGAYDARNPEGPSAKQTSAFASSTKRGAYTSAADRATPGVGAYNPKNLGDGEIVGGGSAFKSTAQRFKGEGGDRNDVVGPGSYSQSMGSLESTTSKAAAARGGNASFGTTSKKEFSHFISDAPGPGEYEASSTGLHSKGADSRPSSAFKSKSLRSQDMSTKSVGDPGAYDPYSGSSVSAQKTFNKTQQTGTGGFGTTSKRAEFSTVSEAPGPGAYDARNPEGPSAKQTSAFASSTKRGAYTSAADRATPGVGAYNPKNLGDGEIVGGGSAFKSTAQRFKGEGGDRNDVVGPGSYSQEESAISRKSAAASGKVSSAFASTTLRDGFLGA